MTERALEVWVGKYVSVVKAPLHGRDIPLTGRIEVVGNDGFIIQPMGASRQTTRDLDPQRFIPWHTVHHVILEGD